MRPILLVDDDAALRLALERCLRQVWHIVNPIVEAQDGRDALVQLVRFEPILTFLDLGMPWMDGLEVLRRLQTAGTKKGRVIVLSGEDGATQVRQAYALGADGYAVKPFDADMIGQALRDSGVPLEIK